MQLKRINEVVHENKTENDIFAGVRFVGVNIINTTRFIKKNSNP